METLVSFGQIGIPGDEEPPLGGEEETGEVRGLQTGHAPLVIVANDGRAAWIRKKFFEVKP
ncbi:hypothetical protein KIN20_033317 [Parelaphostrongylus tenuis]|uniref:Uncharacterized protein n=1 Tax=Parelaphostrongylus tenuis TaxID=148309 RepID=A0AAD5WI59_PARTN|nr:hypothetical protein KIN20_033317 [Parelaphostrongylus tenuis]